MPNQWEDKPKLVVSPVISKLTAAYVKESKITNVSWELDESTPPQLTFTVEIRKNGTDGDLVISHTETSPHKRDIELDTGDLQSGTYYITFEFYDILIKSLTLGIIHLRFNLYIKPILYKNTFHLL